ncbi:serine hydrolase [Flavobacterium sp. DGU11]|uniref:Serine hydrolase n=1 Tax=Flavobacterium arundinis TaxID=3139143 RepID=A0ABU9HRD3_9FLAO
MKIKLLLLFLVCQSAFAQMTSTEVDHLVEDAMKKFNVAGTAVTIVKDGKVIHCKGYGIKSITTKEKVNEHTNFAIASNSKAFTTAALSILVEEGKLSWDDKVIKYIPEFTMYNDYVTANFNIQDLLTHRSGLGLGAGDLMFFPTGSDFTMKDVLTSFQYFEPKSAFRTKWDYDNLLYVVAGEVIERVSGMTWEQFIQTRIMVPLGMDNSYAGLSMMKDKSNLASPHAEVKGTLNKLEDFEEMVNGAAGGIYANVDDLSQWLLVHLNKGKYGHGLKSQLFSQKSQWEMWKIHTVTDVDRNPRYNSHFAGYGLGWDLEDIKGNMSVSHTGGLPGMLSKTIMIPDLNLGIVVLTNTSEGGAGVFMSVTNSIVDSYLGLDDHKWTDYYAPLFKEYYGKADDVSEKVWKTVKANEKIKVKAEDYIGIYEDKWFGKVEVFMKDKQLWLRSLRSPKLNGPMQYYNANTFALKWEYQDMNADAFAIFSLDEEGKAQSIKMKGISPNIDFSFDFQDLDLKRVMTK